MDQSYTRDSRPDKQAGWVLVDPTTMARVRALLRATAGELRRCWWCARPLENGCCAICDAEGAS